MSAPKDIIGTYAFATVNGETVKNEELLKGLPVTLQLEASDADNELKVFAVVGNSYRGKITYDPASHKYKGMLMSTRMAVPQDYMPITRVVDGLMEGATIKKEGSTLTIANDKGTVTYNAM